MFVDIKITNLAGIKKEINRTRHNLINIPPTMIDRASKFLNKSIKARASLASRWAKSGDMAKNTHIKLVDEDHIEVISNSRSGFFQEKGFTAHYVHKSMLSKQAQDNLYPGIQFIKVKKSTPFIKPAVESVNAQIDNWLYDEVKKAI